MRIKLLVTSVVCTNKLKREENMSQDNAMDETLMINDVIVYFLIVV